MQTSPTPHGRIPWSQVAVIGNVFLHDYELVACDIIWRVVQEDLAPLESACRIEPAAVEAQGDVSSEHSGA